MRFFNRRNYNLLRQLVITDFKLRYQGSVLGYLWSLLKPLALFTVLYAVFSHVLRFGDAIPFYPAYLLLGIVFFTFFAEATNNGLRAIVDRGELVSKISIPKYIVVISTVFSSLINLAINLGVVMIFILITGAVISPEALVIIPILLIELVAFSLGVVFLLSALYVYYRDIAYIWEVVVQMTFYATPIIYPLTLVPESIHPYLLLSPLAQIIQNARQVLVTPETTTLASLTSPAAMAIPLTFIVALGVLAVWYFRRHAPYFAEEM